MAGPSLTKERYSLEEKGHSRLDEIVVSLWKIDGNTSFIYGGKVLVNGEEAFDVRLIKKSFSKGHVKPCIWIYTSDEENENSFVVSVSELD